MMPGNSSCNWRLMMAHWSCPVLQMWLLQDQIDFGALGTSGCVGRSWFNHGIGAQEEMVALSLTEEQLWWLHRACVAQDGDWPCKEELAHDHANRDQHTNQAHADHEHGSRVGGVYADHAAAKSIRVAELENDSKDKEEDKHELDHAAERVIAPLAEGPGLLLQR